MIVKTKSKNLHTEAWIVRCDDCGCEAKRPGQEPGEAADKARDEGFKTRIRNVLDPADWACPACNAKPIPKRTRHIDSSVVAP